VATAVDPSMVYFFSERTVYLLLNPLRKCVPNTMSDKGGSRILSPRWRISSCFESFLEHHVDLFVETSNDPDGGKEAIKVYQCINIMVCHRIKVDMCEDCPD
jgi:hypothetical protein